MIVFMASHAMADGPAKPIAVQWQGYDEPIAGLVVAGGDQSGGTMTVALPRGEGTCQGTYRFASAADQSGTWSMACANGVVASGVLAQSGAGGATTGVGADARGRAVKFTIGSPTIPAGVAASVPPVLTADRFDGAWELSLHYTDPLCALHYQGPITIKGGVMQGSLWNAFAGTFRIDAKVKSDGVAHGYVLGAYALVRWAGSFADDQGEGELVFSGEGGCPNMRWKAKRL